MGPSLDQFYILSDPVPENYDWLCLEYSSRIAEFGPDCADWLDAAAGERGELPKVMPNPVPLRATKTTGECDVYTVAGVLCIVSGRIASALRSSSFRGYELHPVVI